MRLKVLMVPFSIILSLILVIGFIKPDYTEMKEKKAILETKLGQSRNMTTLLSNISALTSELDRQAESESFLLSYYPQASDQEQVIDKFNFLAAQAGVFMVTTAFQEIEKDEGEEEEVDPLTAVFDENGVPLPVVEPIKPRTFSGQVTVKGGYENIKDFFRRVAHMNRYHKTAYFSLLTPISSGGSEELDPPGTLVGVFRADFDYLAPRQIPTALNEPMFNRSSLDTARLSAVLSWVTATVPSLQNPTTGRPNPFQ